MLEETREEIKAKNNAKKHEQGNTHGSAQPEAHEGGHAPAAESGTKPGEIKIGFVDIFTEVPKDPVRIRDTPYIAPGTKPASSVSSISISEDAYSADLDAPGKSVFFVRVTANVEGDAEFSESSDVPTISANSVNWTFAQTAGITRENGEPLKQMTTISPDKRTITAIFAFVQNNADGAPGKFTVGFRATSTQGLLKISLWEPKVNPVAKLTITIKPSSIY